jgi:hypothetical protein
MKHIYLSAIALFAAILSVTAQRSPNLTIKGYYNQSNTSFAEITNGNHFLFHSAGGPSNAIEIGWSITNSATAPKDSVMMGDMLHIQHHYSNGSFHWNYTFSYSGIHLPAGQTSAIYPSTAGWPNTPGTGLMDVNSIFNGASGAHNVTWCDSVWIEAGTTTLVNPPAEADYSDNISCKTVVFDGWMTSVDDMDVDIYGDGLLVFPNPSATRDINIMFNFGHTTSKATVCIVDITGKIVYNQSVGSNLSGVQTIALNIPPLAPGMYALRLTAGDKAIIEKIYLY